jgi:hypothetical protein
MFLAKADLASHLYAEIIDEITRADDTKANTAIASAISEAKAYLGKYDLAQLFADAEPAEWDRSLLKDLVKSIAIWKLLFLNNVNVDLKIARTGFEDAKSMLEKIQKGIADPEGWPLKAIDVNTGFPENGSVAYSSNPKRHNHF